MWFIPREVEIFGVYAPPILIDAILGAALMMVTVTLLNKYRLSVYFKAPEVVMLALTAIYTCFIGTFVIPT